MLLEAPAFAAFCSHQAAAVVLLAGLDTKSDIHLAVAYAPLE